MFIHCVYIPLSEHLGNIWTTLKLIHSEIEVILLIYTLITVEQNVPIFYKINLHISPYGYPQKSVKLSL